MRVGGFHFVKSVGIPRPTTEDMVVVWWTSCHIVYFYALVNQGKGKVCHAVSQSVCLSVRLYACLLVCLSVSFV
jgi:hypothetical protein